MTFEFGKDRDVDSILVKISEHDLANKTIGYAMEIIATRLADAYIQKYGDTLLAQLDLDEISELVKKNVVTDISKMMEVKITQHEKSNVD